MVASPLPSRGPTRGLSCYVTPAFSGVPNKEDKIRSGFLTPAFSAELLSNPILTIRHTSLSLVTAPVLQMPHVQLIDTMVHNGTWGASWGGAWES